MAPLYHGPRYSLGAMATSPIRRSGARRSAIVVGAGVIGLAVARALGRAGLDVIVLEAEAGVALHQSSRNSEVVHAGLYYPPGSLKARTCVEGRHRLRALCEREGVPYRRVGKIVVATDPTQIDTLVRLEATARANGVDDVEILPGDAVRRLEPHVRAVAALHSPSTSIIDSDALVRLMWRDAQDAGASLALACPLQSARIDGDDILVTAGGDTVRCGVLVNAAGLGAHAVARSITGLPAGSIPPRHLAKGSYFRVDACPLRSLVYPVPDTASLGIHATVDLHGGVRFGPDQEWVEEIDYTVDPTRASAFADSVRRFWPGLPALALRPDYAGVRAKIQGPADPPSDFVISGPRAHGMPGLVQLFGIESPGLTACLALASEVLAELGIDDPTAA